MTLIVNSSVTGEQLLGMDDDGVDRELIAGKLKERPMTRRNRRHSRTTSIIARVLGNWLASRSAPRGEVLAGEAAFRLRRDPETSVGIDVAYISAEVASANDERAFFIEGVPTLAVEILSPSDTHEDVSEKIAECLRVGVAQVWLADPAFRTITVYRPSAKPVLFNADQHLSGDPELEGCSVRVEDLFI